MFMRLRAPETMTASEQVALLRATAVHDDPRDHVLYLMALGTGLRLAELLGLNVGDVSPDGRQVRQRVTLDPATTKGGRRGQGPAVLSRNDTCCREPPTLYPSSFLWYEVAQVESVDGGR